uniref:Immune mapped protein 2 N-terminal domain-containing protein n=1 Tax=Arcella intermedia TaxID=1963864 RepID=A0A6B2LMX1_9EUKA|eukprot:TRINITY_DN24150_c0_g1_i1.p1 TRINITY_DN24150_c0_g1~~TRINITY_DN24150_c0_g1_i1.p1  ORF type:complete len:178 (+),score=36.36 TRINITY_DN24150_c0_g1_i1:56-535(+)
MSELGEGCYLVFDAASQGTLSVFWSQTPVEGALAYFKPNKTVPKFKYTQNAGRSELIRQICGPNIKRYYQGWTQFVRLAKDFQGDISILRGEQFDQPISLFFVDKQNNVTKAPEKEFFNTDNKVSVSAVHSACLSFQVKTMNPSLFRETAESQGANLTL